jgi:DNA polymerase-3 subunit beta
MRIIIERDTLAEAVAWVARSLPTRPVLPILSGMLLEASTGVLTLSCFDYEVSARIQVDAEVAEPGTALVPGRLLAEITRSLPSQPVEVDHEKDDVIVTCGPASFTLVTLPVKEYPRLPELPLLAGTVDGGALATAIGQVAPAASRDDTLPVITGVNVEIDGGSIRLVATDRYRLAIRELGWNPARPDTRSTMLVPAKMLSDAARMMAPGVPVRVMIRGELASSAARAAAASAGDSLHAAEAMIGFESAGRRLTTRLIAGEYIKYMSRFPEGFGSRGDMPAIPLTEAVKRVALVAERGSSVRLSFGHGKVTIEAGTEGQGNRHGRLHRRGDRDRVQPALPDGRPGRGPDRGHRRTRHRGKAAWPGESIQRREGTAAREGQAGREGLSREGSGGYGSERRRRRARSRAGADMPAVHQPDQAGADHRQCRCRRRR